MPFKLDFAILASEQLSDLKSTNVKKHIAVFRLLSITGKDNWKRLVGSPVRILLEDDLIRNVGHIYKDEWLKEK